MRGVVPKKYVMFRKTTRMLRTQRLMEDVKKSEIDVKTRFVTPKDRDEVNK